MFRIIILFAAALATAASAEVESTIVVRHATEAVLVDGNELPRSGLGLWRLEPGSTVESKTGFVELAIGEGACLRLRPGTLVKLTSEGESSIEMQLERGAAALDVLRDPEKSLKIGAAQSSLQPDGKGSYSIEASPPRFAAHKGKAEVATPAGAVSLKSKTFVAGDGAAGAQKLAKTEQDAFEEWREERNREMILEQRRDATFAERTMRPAR